MALTKLSPELMDIGTVALQNTGQSVGEVPLVGESSATESVAGLIQLATIEQVNSTADNLAITPFSLKQFIQKNVAGSLNLTEDGSFEIPGGIKIHFGITATIPTGESVAIQYPEALANQTLQVLAIPLSPDS